MSVFDKNITTPPSIISLGREIKECCISYMDSKYKIYRKAGYGIPGSIATEQELRNRIKTNFQDRLENNAAGNWRFSLIKYCNGAAQVWFHMTFRYFETNVPNTHILFEHDYYFRPGERNVTI